MTGKDLERAATWLSQSALGKEPKPTTLHLAYINASKGLAESMLKRRVIAAFFAFILAIGVVWVRPLDVDAGCVRQFSFLVLPSPVSHTAGLGRLLLCARIFALLCLLLVHVKLGAMVR